MKNQLRALFIKIYLYYYLVYQYVYQFVIKLFGPINIIYCVSNNNITNVTLSYYFGFMDGIEANNDNTHYIVKCYDKNHTKYYGFSGKISDLKKIELDEKLHPREKNITLSKNGSMVNIDITVIDNYINNVKKNKLEHKISTENIFNILNIDCSHVKIISMKPFRCIEKHIDEIDLFEIYD